MLSVAILATSHWRLRLAGLVAKGRACRRPRRRDPPCAMAMRRLTLAACIARVMRASRATPFGVTAASATLRCGMCPSRLIAGKGVTGARACGKPAAGGLRRVCALMLRTVPRGSAVRIFLLTTQPRLCPTDDGLLFCFTAAAALRHGGQTGSRCCSAAILQLPLFFSCHRHSAQQDEFCARSQ